MSSELDLIENQLKELQAKKKAILDSQKSTVLEEVKATIQQYGFTAIELGLSTKKKSATKSKLEPKYVNPLDATQTWHGGRGKKPNWVNEYLAAGKKLEDIEIKKPE